MKANVFVRFQSLTYMVCGITREGMIEVDRIMTEDLGIHVELMMEHAGLNLAKLVNSYCSNNKSIIAICGSGNNGGGGMVAARRLKAWGLDVSMHLPKGQPEHQVLINQLQRAKNCGVKILDRLPKDNKSILIDALIGYNFRGEIRSDIKNSVQQMRESETICLDIPTGIDSNLGVNKGKIQPLATLTLAYPKIGMLKHGTKDLGELYLADIGIPKWVLENRRFYREDFSSNKKKIDNLYKNFRNKSIMKLLVNNGTWKFKEK